MTAIFEYTNSGDETYRVVTIECEVLDAAGNLIDVNKRSFFDHY